MHHVRHRCSFEGVNGVFEPNGEERASIPIVGVIHEQAQPKGSGKGHGHADDIQFTIVNTGANRKQMSQMWVTLTADGIMHLDFIGRSDDGSAIMVFDCDLTAGEGSGHTWCTATPCTLPLGALLSPCAVCGTGEGPGPQRQLDCPDLTGTWVSPEYVGHSILANGPPPPPAARNPMKIEITRMDGPENACRVYGTNTWSYKDGSYSGQDPIIGIIHQLHHPHHPHGMVRAV